MRNVRFLLLAALALVVLFLSSAPATSATSLGSTERVSVASSGSQANSSSYRSSISADGRYVAFESFASNLVPGGAGGRNVFVRDQQTRTTDRVSEDSAGNPGNAMSAYPTISADGRYVAFYSFASNLVGFDTNGFGDVFVHDRQTGVTERVSLDSYGNEGNGDSFGERLAISTNGRYVAFQSDASNLVPVDTNGEADIFVHDRQTGATERVSVDSYGNESNDSSWWPSISADGRYVAFNSHASNLVPEDFALCGSPPDMYSCYDVFVHDRQTGVTERVSVDSFGEEGNDDSWEPSISADGRYVAFPSYASNLVPNDTAECVYSLPDTYNCSDIFVHDRQTGVTKRVSVDRDGNQANGDSWWAAISANGRYVAFGSLASNLVPGDTNNFCNQDSDDEYDDSCEDIFVHDRYTGAMERVSVDSAGDEGNGDSLFPAISASGRYVAFESAASNLVQGDTNGGSDIFWHDRVRDFKQRDDAWDADHLADDPNCFTLAQGGCALSAVADVLSYYGTLQLTQGFGAVNPGNLNSWLSSHGGYDGCAIYWSVADNASGGYVSDPQILRSWHSLAERRQAVHDALTEGKLPIVRVTNRWGGPHWIVLSGESGDSYTIVDPDGPSGGRLSDTYGAFYDVVIYGVGTGTKSWSVVGHSPIQLLVTDPLGRQTGYDLSTGAVVEDIPLSSYGVEPGIGDDDGVLPALPDRPYFEQNDPLEGTYSIQAIGVGEGPYDLVVTQVVDSGQTSEQILTGTATPGSVDTFEIQMQTAGPVGGIAELPDVAQLAASQPYSPPGSYIPLGAFAVLVVLAVIAISTGAWYAAKRRD